MRLAGGTCFLGSSEYGSVLFMRDDYIGMLEELAQLFAAGLRKVVVSGNPGIGKSWFGFVVLYHIATETPRARVVWEASHKRRRYLFDGGAVLQGSADSFSDVLDDESAWFIVDDVEKGGPVHADAKMIVLSSPKRENYNSILKAIGATIRYMPVWSWGEIEACHALLYAGDPERPLAEVEAAYKRWGGIPRYVLEKLRDSATQSMLDQAIACTNLSKVVDAVNDLASADNLSHRMLHIAVERPYVDTTIVFGSAVIAGLVLAKLEAQVSSTLA